MPSPIERLVLLSSGLDSIHRGYETFTRLLFNTLQAESCEGWEIHLFKRDGRKAVNETRLFSLRRDSRFATLLAKCRGTRSYWAQLTFAGLFLIYVFVSRFRASRILTMDPVLCKMIYRFRFVIPGNPQVVFLHGVRMTPEQYLPYADRVQEVNCENYERASNAPTLQKPSCLLPHFVRSESTRSLETKENFRKEWGVQTSRLLLSVGVVDRSQKRTDFLISEMCQMSPDWTLLVCGPVTDPQVIEEGRKKLGHRFIHRNVLPNQMGAVYGAADLFASGSLDEGFGLSIVEAMALGLPVLVHRRPHFEWLVKDPEQCVDMTKSGEFARRVQEIGAAPDWLSSKGQKNIETVRLHYSWPALRLDYLSWLFSGATSPNHM